MSGPEVPATPDWEEVLEGMERRVAQGERYLAGERVEIDRFVRPAGLGPLPVELGERARAVLAATKEIEHRFEMAMGDVAYRSYCLNQAKSRVATVFAPGRPSPVYVDRAG